MKLKDKLDWMKRHYSKREYARFRDIAEGKVKVVEQLDLFEAVL